MPPRGRYKSRSNTNLKSSSNNKSNKIATISNRVFRQHVKPKKSNVSKPVSKPDKQEIKKQINANSKKSTPARPQMSPPIPKKEGITISSGSSGFGATISTSNASGKSLIYKDPNTGSTIATKSARDNIASGGDYNIVASTSAKNPPMGVSQIDPSGTKTMTQTAPKTLVGDVLYQKPKPPVTAISQTGITHVKPIDAVAQAQQNILTNLSNPTPKTDLLLNTPVKKPPTLLTQTRRKKGDKRGMSGGNWWSAMIRTLLG